MNRKRIRPRLPLCNTSSMQRAYGQIYREVQRQASVLAYIDVVWIMVALCILAIDLLFFAKKAKPGQSAMAH